MTQIEWTDFEKIDIRTGTIIHAEDAIGTHKPAYRLKIDFGEIGVKASSAQLTHHYSVEDLIGKQVIAVVNFKPKQIGKYISECLVLGVVGSGNEVVLLRPDRGVQNGQKIA